MGKPIQFRLPLEWNFYEMDGPIRYWCAKAPTDLKALSAKVLRLPLNFVKYDTYLDEVPHYTLLIIYHTLVDFTFVQKSAIKSGLCISATVQSKVHFVWPLMGDN